MNSGVCGVAFVVLAGCSSPSISEDTARSYWGAALNCSQAKLRQYALTSNEAADLVASAAYNACSREWLAANEAYCSSRPRCDAELLYMVKRQSERGYIAKSAATVIEIRSAR